MRRLKSSCSRSIALALGINFDRVCGYRKKVNSRAPNPSRARVAPEQRPLTTVIEKHFRLGADHSEKVTEVVPSS